MTQRGSRSSLGKVARSIGWRLTIRSTARPNRSGSSGPRTHRAPPMWYAVEPESARWKNHKARWPGVIGVIVGRHSVGQALVEARSSLLMKNVRLISLIVARMRPRISSS